MSARACLTYLATTALLATLAACGASTPSNTDQDTAVSGTGEDVGNDPADTATGPDDAVPRLTLVSSPPPLGTDAHPRLVLASTKPATLWVFGACGPRSFPIAAGSNEVELAEDGPWPDGEYADCTVQAIGNDGGVGDTVAIPAFAIDTVAPTVTSVVPVPPAVASASPIVVLSVSEAAEVAWSGCSGPATLAAGAEVQVTLAGANGSPLVDGSYPDCSLAPRDAAGNVGEILALPPFVVDTVAPTFTLVTGPGERTNDPRPQVTVAVDEVITLGATGACRASTQVLAAGTRDLRLTAPGGGDLSDGTFTDCALVASDTAGHEVSMAIPGFTIDTVAPAVSDVEPPRASGNNPRPLLVLTASEAGWLELDGDCASASTAVTAGANSVALHGPDDAPLTDGQKSCGLRLQDLAGNPSERFAIPPFTIDTVPPTLTLVSWPPPSGNSSLVAIEVSASEGGRLGAGGPCRPSPLEIGAGITRVNLTGAEGPLDDGLYADCTVSLVDDAGNDSAIVSVPAFRIDTPSLDFISLPPTYGTDRHPALTIWTSHAGDVRIFGGCEPSVDAIAAGVQTLGLGGSGSGPGLADGAYACTFELTNTAGRSATIAIPEFHIDNVAPTLSATGPAAPTNAPVAEVVVAEAVTLSGTGCRPGVTTLVAGTHIVP